AVVAERVPDGVTLISASGVDGYSPSVAWRAIVTPDGRSIAMAHQRGRATPLFVHTRPPSSPTGTAAGGYGAATAPSVTCPSGVVHGAVTYFDLDGSAPHGGDALVHAVLPVDLAITGDAVSLVAAGNQAGVGAVLTGRFGQSDATRTFAERCTTPI